MKFIMKNFYKIQLFITKFNKRQFNYISSQNSLKLLDIIKIILIVVTSLHFLFWLGLHLYLLLSLNLLLHLLYRLLIDYFFLVFFVRKPVVPTWMTVFHDFGTDIGQNQPFVLVVLASEKDSDIVVTFFAMFALWKLCSAHSRVDC